MMAIHQHRVLLVEDNVDTRDAIVLILELQGYGTAVASDGYEGLRVARESVGLCLILLDANMPGMDGVGFRREQLADERLRKVPVVVVSALPHYHPMLRPLAGLEMAQKPLDARELIALVEKYCRPDPEGCEVHH